MTRSILDDVRYAWRTLRHSPWYALTVVGVLGMGLALATTVFALVDGVLFKPLPFARPSELFLIRASISTQPRVDPPPVSWREINAWTEAVPELLLTVVSPSPLEWERTEHHEYWSARVDARFFEVVGQAPRLGGFTPADYDWDFKRIENGSAWQPILISHRMWHQMFGGDPNVVGRTVTTRVDGKTTFGVRVAGVLPQNFVFPIDVGPAPDVLIPISSARRISIARDLYAVGRIPPPTSAAGIGERLRAATRRLAESAPPAEALVTPHGVGGPPFDDLQLAAVVDLLAKDERPAFALVSSAAALMLLLACVNVAGLAASRNIERRRDLSVRRALGASGWRLSRGIIAETGLLVTASIGLGLLLARPLLVWTVDLLPVSLTLMKMPAIDARVFSAIAVIAAATVVFVSLLPAVIATRIRPVSVLNALGGMWTPIGRRSHFVLVATQVGTAFVLMIAGGLTAVSLADAWRTEAGFTRDRTVLLEAFVVRDSGGNDRVLQLMEAQAALASMADAGDVAVSSIQPLFARRSLPWTTVVPEGWTGPLDRISARRVTADFFRVLGLDLVKGRWPVPGEWRESQRVAMVSETAERLLWQGRSAIGQRLVPPRGRKAEPITVIGVVADARFAALDTEPISDIYLTDPITSSTTGVYFHVRTRNDADRVAVTAAAILRARGLRVEQATSHEAALLASLKHRVLPAWLFGSLGLTALLVLGTGVLGLLAISAAQRTREIGIRMAFGATAPAVIRLMVGEQLTAVLSGLLGGILVSVWAVRSLESQLFGVGAYDPLVWTVVAITLVSVALIGGLVPASRAARVDPVVALRVE
jgi:putative ABC transport system permease protein